MLKTLFRVIRLDQSILQVICLYGAGIALLTLAVPISVQSLISVVSFGTLMQPILVISAVLFLILMFVAALRIAQAMVIETLQQGIFSHVALRLVHQLPKSCSDHLEFEKQRPIMNFFFETQTVQKAVAVLLVIGVDIVLVSFFSMLLIAFYHPALLFFDFIVILAMSIAIYWPWRQALRYAMEECTCKHDVAYYLQELMTNLLFYKFQENAKHLLDRTDKKIVKYLEARKKHFTQILKHMISINLIYVVGNAGLLAVGGWLVVSEQLTLGQLVASELVVNTLLFGFVRLSLYLQDVYDLLASCEKLDRVLSLKKESYWSAPVEDDPTILGHDLKFPRIIHVTQLPYNSGPMNEEKQVSFSLAPGAPVLLYQHDGIAKSGIVDQVLRLRASDNGLISVNNVTLSEVSLSVLRDHTALLRRPCILTGTVMENLTLNRSGVSIDQLYVHLKAFGLDAVFANLPDGLKTRVSPLSHPFTVPEVCLINWVRALMKEPKFWVIDGFLDLLRDAERQRLLDVILEFDALVLITTASKRLAAKFDKKVLL